MNSVIELLAILGFLIFVQQPSPTQGWRGIVPLYSTRADVERLFGQSESQCKCIYYLEDVNLFFLYSSGRCKTGGSGGWDVPADTVIWFTVMIEPMPLAELTIDISKSTKREDGHVEGVVDYVNETDGLLIEVNQGMVRAFTYFPAARDEHLRCKPPRSRRTVMQSVADMEGFRSQ